MENFSMECFIAVAESGSFTKAAALMNRTQSAITQQISNLEKKINARLLNRDKKVSLTQDGELFLQYAYRMRKLHEEILDRFKHPELDGEVRIGVPEDFAALFLSDVLANFSRIHPRIFLSVECDLTLNLLKRFKEGLLDLVVIKMSTAHEIPNGVDIWKEPLVWVKKRGASLSTNPTKPLPLVLSPEPCIYRARAIQALENAGIRWRIVYTSPSYAGIVAAVKADMGVTVYPLTMIPDELEMISEPILPALPDIHVSLLKHEQKSNPAIETLNEFLLHKLVQGKHSTQSKIPAKFQRH